MDQFSGELSREAGELLDHYLSQNPAARAEALAFKEAMLVTERSLRTQPNLFFVHDDTPAESTTGFRFPAKLRPFAMAAAIGLFGLVGFMIGANSSKESVVSNQTALLASGVDSPWATYHISDNSDGSIEALVISVK